MRKNKMMRLASMLLVLTLLSTCMISGTFAKYVTTATGSDSARVAKWGITMNTDKTSTFTDTYNSSVDSDDGKDVVAPGTNGTAKYFVAGAPETAYEITFAGTADNDVFLASGLTYAYADVDPTNAENGVVAYTTPGPGASGTLAADYYPIYYTVTVTAANGDFDKIPSATSDSYIKESGKAQYFDTLEAAMAALSNTKVSYAVNEEAGMTVQIDWAWAFDNTTTEEGRTTVVDAYDTILGDIVANNGDLTINDTLMAPFDAKVVSAYNTNIGYTLTMTATQVD